MSETPLHAADEAARHINHLLRVAGSCVRVSAIIDADDLIVRGEYPYEEYMQTFPRSPFKHWFLSSIVNQAAPYFSAIQPTPRDES